MKYYESEPSKDLLQEEGGEGRGGEREGGGGGGGVNRQLSSMTKNIYEFCQIFPQDYYCIFLSSYTLFILKCQKVYMISPKLSFFYKATDSIEGSISVQFSFLMQVPVSSAWMTF